MEKTMRNYQVSGSRRHLAVAMVVLIAVGVALRAPQVANALGFGFSVLVALRETRGGPLWLGLRTSRGSPGKPHEMTPRPRRGLRRPAALRAGDNGIDRPTP
jgi:hypothetical protein